MSFLRKAARILGVFPLKLLSLWASQDTPTALGHTHSMGVVRQCEVRTTLKTLKPVVVRKQEVFSSRPALDFTKDVRDALCQTGVAPCVVGVWLLR